MVYICAVYYRFEPKPVLVDIPHRNRPDRDFDTGPDLAGSGARAQCAMVEDVQGPFTASTIACNCSEVPPYAHKVLLVITDWATLALARCYLLFVLV